MTRRPRGCSPSPRRPRPPARWPTTSSAVSLGAIVHEVDLDEDDDAERDEGALVDDEAEEGNDDDDE